VSAVGGDRAVVVQQNSTAVGVGVGPQNGVELATGRFDLFRVGQGDVARGLERGRGVRPAGLHDVTGEKQVAALGLGVQISADVNIAQRQVVHSIQQGDILTGDDRHWTDKIVRGGVKGDGINPGGDGGCAADTQDPALRDIAAGAPQRQVAGKRRGPQADVAARRESLIIDG